MQPVEEKIDFTKITFAKDKCPCGYYPERECTQLFNMSTWFNIPEFQINGKPFPITEYYGFLKRNGFCRYNSLFYRYECKNCRECTPVRIPVDRFSPSKNQRAAWNKNQDVKVVLVKERGKFVSEERALLYREYDAYHNGSQAEYKKMTIQEAMDSLEKMNGGYDGIWNLEYWLNDRLIGVSILDYTVDADGNINSICSNYFYYEISPQIEKRSIGVFSVLKELELCREQRIPYYYLGLYLHNCKKMNYKTNYEPYELLIDGVWVCSDLLLPEAGEIYEEFPEVCFVTKEVELPILVSAYKQGIFPWFSEEDNEPVIWRSVDLRYVIPVNQMHVPKTLKKFLKKTPYTYTMDKCFTEVMTQCGLMERKGQTGTWIGPKMIKAYTELHKLGYAHSFEVWHEDKLVGGFYGVLLGSVFCGESMFTKESSSSSSAFVLFAKAFEKCGGKMIDCQVYTPNMARYKGIELPRNEFVKLHTKYQKSRLSSDLKTVFEKLASDTCGTSSNC